MVVLDLFVLRWYYSWSLNLILVVIKQQQHGITRLSVYAGLTGFYIIRDDKDNGDDINNPLNLPTGEYDKAYCIQDRMFKENGELFYPAFQGR